MKIHKNDDSLNNFKDDADRLLQRVSISSEQKKNIALACENVSKDDEMLLRPRGRWLKYAGGAIAAMAAMVFMLSPIMRPTPNPGKDMPAMVEGAINIMDVKAWAERPEKEGSVATDTGFYLELGENKVEEKELKACLSFSPSTEFTVEQKSDTSFYIKPTEALSTGVVYSLRLNSRDAELPLSWAFQTQSTMSVASSIPATDSNYVPVNTGVEIIFSQAVESVEAIKITPEVNGEIDISGRVVTFIPSKSLEYDTVYTVEVLGAKGVDGDSFKDENGSYSLCFRTAENIQKEYEGNIYYADSFTETFLTTDPVAVKLWSSGSFDSENYSVSLYKLEGKEQYLTLGKGHYDFIESPVRRSYDSFIDTQQLQPIMTFESKLYKQNSYSPAYIIFPENPKEGYYLVDIVSKGSVSEGTKGKRAQKLVSVSDLALYAQSQNEDTIIWLNSAKTGVAVENATVTIEMEDIKQSANTDSSGLARLKSPKDGLYTIDIASGEESFADLVRFSGNNGEQAENLYFSYIYTDREAYLPTDTIRFWGYVRPRHEGTKVPESVAVKIDGIYDAKINLDENGTFIGEIPIERAESRYYTIGLDVNNKSLSNTALSGKWVEVREYRKPVYTMSLKTDKPYYKRGESITTNAEARFFDGSAAAGIDLYVSDSGRDGKEGKTDKDGRFSVTSAPSENKVALENSGGNPIAYDIYGRIQGNEDVAVSRSVSPYYFPTDYIIKPQLVENEKKLEIASAQIDYGKVEALIKEKTDLEYDKISGTPWEVTGTVNIIEHSYAKRARDTYYDFIQKKNITTYVYDNVKNVVDSFTFTTENGSFVSKSMEYLDQSSEKYYVAEITYTTPEGDVFTTNKDITPWQNPLYEHDKKQYSFKTLSADLKTGGVEENNWFSENTQVKLELLENQTSLEKLQGAMMYTLATDKAIGISVTENSSFSIPFDERYVPNLSVAGAYFDGTHIYPIYQNTLFYDYKERELNIEIATDKQAYRPKEEARVELKITDKQGNPVKANYVLSVSDEAAFAVSEQYVSAISKAYQTIAHPTIKTFASYVQHDINGDGDGKGGDGGGEGERSVFVDTAAFMEGMTDENGVATLSFTVPDNITSWRLTSVAIGTEDRLMAGNARANIAATIDFFLNPVVSKRYTSKDDVNITLRSGGKALEGQNSPVTYTAVLEGENLKEERVVTGNSFENMLVSFGKLKVGQYSLTISGQFKDSKDSIKLSLEVVESMFEATQFVPTPLSELPDITPSKTPVTLYLYDGSSYMYMSALSYLSSVGGERVDERLARAYAGEKLAQVMAQPQPMEEELPYLQDYSGAVKLYEYSSPDPLLTAKAIMAAPHMIDVNKGVSYLYSILNNKASPKSHVSAAYMGLGAAGQPVLLEMQALIKDDSFSLNDKLYFAIGLALLGDMESAGEFYHGTIRPLLISDNQTKMFGATKGACGDDYLFTSESALLSFLINNSDYKAMFNYLTSVTPTKNLPIFEIMAYLERGEKPENSDATFSYSIDGRRITESFEKSVVHTLVMSKSQFESADFKSPDEDVYACVSFTGMGLTGQADDRISVDKKYNITDGGREISVLITVKFQDGLPEDGFIVTDYLPTGMRFISHSYTNENWHFVKNEDQKVEFYLNRKKYIGENLYQPVNEFQISYTARKAVGGEYLAEGAAVIHTSSQLYGLSQSTMVSLP